MKNLRKQILTLAEAESQIKLPAGFKKPEGWDEASDEDKKQYLHDLEGWKKYINGGWKADGGITIPQAISQLQQIYKKHGDVRLTYYGEDEEITLVNKFLFDEKNNRIVVYGQNIDDYSYPPSLY
jgi:hypothetical protein